MKLHTGSGAAPIEGWVNIDVASYHASDMSSDPTTPSRSVCLIAGGVASAAVAILHVAIIVVGARGYAYFGAGQLALMVQQGSQYPAFITTLITVVFLLWAAYAFSGAGLLPRLPLLRTALVSIALIYSLRGLIVIGDIIRLLRGAPYPFRHAVFSATALVIGILYGAGTARMLLRRRE